MYGYERAASTIIFVGVIVAVKLFFIISGFYMAMIFEKHYSTTDMFLVSRAVRLFPAYWLTMAFSVVAALWLKTPDVGPLLNLDFWYLVREPVAVFLFTLSNLTFLGIDFGSFTCIQLTPAIEFAFNWKLPCPEGQVLLVLRAVVPPAWTLSLEWYFYLLVPLFCGLTTRRVALVAGCSFLLALFIAVFANFHPWNRALFPAELYLFLLGFLAYRLKHLIPRAVGGDVRRARCCHNTRLSAHPGFRLARSGRREFRLVSRLRGCAAMPVRDRKPNTGRGVGRRPVLSDVYLPRAGRNGDLRARSAGTDVALHVGCSERADRRPRVRAAFARDRTDRKISSSFQVRGTACAAIGSARLVAQPR